MPTLLLDIDGVLRAQGEALSGAKALLGYLNDTGQATCLLSNSSKTRSTDLKANLEALGLPVGNLPVMTALDATLVHVTRYERVAVFAKPEVVAHFGSRVDAENPQAIVLGDLEDGWSVKVLNEAFRLCHDKGAKIVAIHHNRYGQHPVTGKLQLDVGAYCEAIEYASGQVAQVMGKPTKAFFDAGRKLAGGPPNDPFVMIGDDIVSDIQGAMELDGKGILILSGKTSKEDLEKSPINPDRTVEDLPEFLDLLKRGVI